MNVNDLLSLLLIVLSIVVGLSALLLVCDVVFTSIVGRARVTIERMPIRAFVVGLVNMLFFGLIAAALLSKGQTVRLLGVGVGTILLSFVALGLAAVARFVGERLRPNDPSPVRRLLAGALALELAASAPFVGWFVVPILAGVIGYGAIIIALLWRRPARAETAPAADADGYVREA